jgi:hypothetical protein
MLGQAKEDAKKKYGRNWQFKLEGRISMSQLH